MTFPRICLVKQHLEDRSLPDVALAVRQEMERSRFAERVRPGARIAVGAGSRGISNIALIVKSVVRYWLDHGCRPFVFPAMGSHGSATAEGQARVLAGYGITEQALGCPVVSSLEVVATGRTPEGIETYIDRHAFESDAVMLVGRVKWHTDFDGRIESGLIKMAAIGLGKLAGAQSYHMAGRSLGLEQVIRSVFKQVKGTGKLLGGLAILEDARHATAHLEALPVEAWEQREPELLALAKSWRTTIPAKALDLLIIDEIGKDISGTGMDTKVVNRSIQGLFNCYQDLPIIQRIFVRDLSQGSGGNGIGMGMADIVSDRLLAKVDWQATYLNSLTACNPEGSRMPVHFPTDRECLERIAPTTGCLDTGQLRLCWIANTLRLDLLAVSENLLDELLSKPQIEVISEPLELPFDQEGNLPRLGELVEAARGAA